MIEQLLSLPQDTIRLADIGAAFFGEPAPYSRLLETGLAQLFAFETDQRETDKLRQHLGARGTVIPCAVGGGFVHTLHVCPPESGMSSLLEPDPDALNFFNLFPQFGKVESTIAVTTRRLDDIDELPPADFLKMDVQGSELMILANGRKKLADCVAVQTEISFITLYKDQPTFGDIDRELRSQGFIPHRFTEVKRWSIAPVVRGNEPRLPFNQLLEGDIVYVRDIIRPSTMSDHQLAKLAVIAQIVYNSPDLVGRCIIELQKRKACAPSLLERYLQTIK